MEGADQRRLERYDLFAKQVHVDLARAESDLAQLRAEGKTHGTLYQQLDADLTMLRQIVERLGDAGL